MAHLGVIRLLEEEGIPIDFVCGVSIGAFIGGLYAKYDSYLDTYTSAVRLAGSLANKLNLLLDVTLPFTSWFDGFTFSREIHKVSKIGGNE